MNNYLDMNKIIFSFLISFLITFITIPIVIKMVHKFGLLDLPDDRKSHKAPVPTMGGIGIYVGILVSVLLNITLTTQVISLLISVTIMFITGIIDDMMNLKASLKLMIQLIVSFILVYSGFNITGLFGFLGIQSIPLMVQYPLSIISIVGIMNAFNLIDGIDSLAASLGLLICSVFSWLFFMANEIPYLYLSVSVAAALLAFLKYNYNPARIFMGDTGSLLLGTMISILTIHYLALIEQKSASDLTPVQSPALIVALIAIPVFDTLRVFTMRLLKGNSPFKADRTHIHHILIDKGLSHNQAVFLILMLGILIIYNAWYSILAVEYVVLMLFVLYVIVIRIFYSLNWIKNTRITHSNWQQIEMLKGHNPFYKINSKSEK